MMYYGVILKHRYFIDNLFKEEVNYSQMKNESFCSTFNVK